MADIMIPRLGMAMTEGTLAEWVVADGGTVAAGDVIYRLETDKVENEVEAPVAGVLRHEAEAGEVYPIGTVIGVIEEG